MMKVVCLVVLFALISTSLGSRSLTQKPQSNPNFKINSTDNECAFLVETVTSCSSTSHTKDEISLVFGDASGNQVDAPRLNDPRTSMFDQYATASFGLRGPCMSSDICYLNIYRSGDDGWMPESVIIYELDIMKPIQIYLNEWIPANDWYRVGYCNYKRGSQTVSLSSK
ncbi:hypothetical protein QVD17_10982 [Tagetes erecta]|uniref:Uncharacterized protein n=1 Tax=Tagetes erecta TaxID=13708 RepID=A0AAD8L4D3_TARER|nr:hypothetical protein QVD17_10982 [Tagetes erecta]